MMNTRAPDGAIDAQWQIWDFARNLSAFVDDNRTTYNLGKKNIKPLLSCAWLKQWRKQHIFHIYCIWIISFHVSLPATYFSCSSKDMSHRTDFCLETDFIASETALIWRLRAEMKYPPLCRCVAKCKCLELYLGENSKSLLVSNMIVFFWDLRTL